MTLFQKKFQPPSCCPAVPVAPPEPQPPSVIERVELLIKVSDRLASVLAREAIALERKALSEVSALQPEKRSLSARFDEIGRLIRLDKASLMNLAPDYMARLREESWRLCEITSANVKALDVQSAARKSMIEVVVKSVNLERQAETAYAGLSRGYVPRSARTAGERSMTINTTL